MHTAWLRFKEMQRGPRTPSEPSIMTVSANNPQVPARGASQSYVRKRGPLPPGCHIGHADIEQRLGDGFNDAFSLGGRVKRLTGKRIPRFGVDCGSGSGGGGGGGCNANVVDRGQEDWGGGGRGRSVGRWRRGLSVRVLFLPVENRHPEVLLHVCVALGLCAGAPQIPTKGVGRQDESKRDGASLVTVQNAEGTSRDARVL